MIVHDGALYAATAGFSRWPHANSGDFGRVYRYRGEKQWEDIGQPGDHFRINSLASYHGKLYALSINTYGASGGGVYVYDGGSTWTQCGDSDDLIRAEYTTGHSSQHFPKAKSLATMATNGRTSGTRIGHWISAINYIRMAIFAASYMSALGRWARSPY